MSDFLISQIFAGAALIAGLVSFQLKKREAILIGFATMSSLYSFHFYMLGLNTPAVIGAASVVRFLLSIKYNHKWLMYFFLGVTAILGYWTYEVWFNILSIVAAALGVWSTFQTDEKRLRIIMMVSHAIMITHDIIAQTPMGIALMSTMFVSGLVGYWRFYRGGHTTEVIDKNT